MTIDNDRRATLERSRLVMQQRVTQIDAALETMADERTELENSIAEIDEELAVPTTSSATPQPEESI